ncbi:MAG: hypothetical protein V1770_04270 [bacterium]
MEKHAYNLLRQEGLKNEDDLSDMTTFAEADAEALKERIEVEKYLDYNLNEREIKTLEMIEEFIKELSGQYIEVFHKVLEDFKNKNNKPSEQLKNYFGDLEKIYKAELDLPRFAIYNKEYARDFLDECEFINDEIGPQGFLLKFQLPKIMADNWHDRNYRKDSNEEFFTENIHKNGQVGIGDLYRTTMKVVWGMYGYYENEKGLYMDRINAINQHDKDKYYYLWEANYYK